MNIRKNIDYSKMYEELDMLMTQQLSQIELYCEIGKTVCQRTEKGAAVMASEYLNKHYPNVKGFSPRSLRRMRDFYRTYENHPALLSLAMQIGWIQNMVIMEAELPMELRKWYMKASKQHGWSKVELIANIAANAHENTILNIEDEICQALKTHTAARMNNQVTVRLQYLTCRLSKYIRKWRASIKNCCPKWYCFCNCKHSVIMRC